MWFKISNHDYLIVWKHQNKFVNTSLIHERHYLKSKINKILCPLFCVVWVGMCFVVAIFNPVDYLHSVTHYARFETDELLPVFSNGTHNIGYPSLPCIKMSLIFSYWTSFFFQIDRVPDLQTLCCAFEFFVIHS